MESNNDWTHHLPPLQGEPRALEPREGWVAHVLSRGDGLTEGWVLEDTCNEVGECVPSR